MYADGVSLDMMSNPGESIRGAGTVFIVDDAREIRTALSRLLTAAGFAVRAFDSAGRYLDEQDLEAPGCLLLDMCMPGMNGLELQRMLVHSPYARPIVFLTGQGDIQSSVQAMKAGAVDFLTKPIEDERLVAAIERALKRDAAERQERTIRNAIQQRFLLLTPRERQVMTHVIRGRLNKQIAADLGTGEKTIKVHRARVMSKLVVRSVAELVKLGARVSITMDPPSLSARPRIVDHEQVVPT
ncbi:MAG TPA: response regulator [Steroidobacteraceae bacterium]|jgi:FixJ family two-component response regulator|nr:response regulator [Steroidobacteraceae bacterium]